MNESPVFPTRRSILEHAKASRVDGESALREVAFNQLLRRLERGAPGRFLVKGGQALRARDVAQRRTLDLDVLGRGTSVRDSAAELTRCASIELGDGLTFTTPRQPVPISGQDTGGYAGLQVKFDCAQGARPFVSLKIDVVTGREPSGRSSTTLAALPLELPGVSPASIHVYPIEDHAADKAAAISTVYPGDRPSSRVRDLYDLCAIARSSALNLATPAEAIELEAARRDLPRAARLSIPASFEARWRPVLADGSPRDRVPEDFEEACALARALIDPVLEGNETTGVWDPQSAAWRAA